MRKTITVLLLSALLLCVPLAGRCQEIDLSAAPSPTPEADISSDAVLSTSMSHRMISGQRPCRWIFTPRSVSGQMAEV